MLTADAGKISLLARGVRKPKSKLAGGIELFSVSSITYIRGRGELSTLVSTRLEKHYGAIVQQLERVQLGYDLIKMLHRATEDETEEEYFTLLHDAFRALDDKTVDLALIRLWFTAQLLYMSGHAPNLQTDASGQPLQARNAYTFDFDSVSFSPHQGGAFTSNHIKFLRLVLAGNSPKALQQVQGSQQLVPGLMPLLQTMLTSYIRV